MVTVLAPIIPNQHWSAVHEEVWSMVSQATNMDMAESITGTNIQLAGKDGKMFFHQDKLLKFTNILDFANEDKLLELADPWGTLTIVMPWVKMEVFQALGRLVYMGDSGNLSDEKSKIT